MTPSRKGYRFGVKVGPLYHGLALAHAQRAAEDRVVADARRIVSGRQA